MSEANWRLIEAVKRGDTQLAATWLARGASANTEDSDYSSSPRKVLVLAAAAGDDAMVEVLLRHGANPDSRNDFPFRVNFHEPSPSQNADNGKTALMYAAEAGSVPVVQRLIRAGAKVDAATRYDETALMFAAGNGQAEAVRALVDAGADITAAATVEGAPALRFRTYGGTALVYALRMANERRAKAREPSCAPYLGAADALVAAYERSRKSLGDARAVAGYAVSCNDVRLAERLVSLGAVQKGTDILIFAGGPEDRSQVVRVLVRAGADVNARTAKPWDDTPLMRAASGGSVPTLAALLDAGASINAVNSHGESALWHAARSAHPKAVALLLSRGADPNLRTEPNPQWFTDGGTALGIAVDKECLDCARELLARGADPRIPDAAGRAPLDALRKAGLVP